MTRWAVVVAACLACAASACSPLPAYYDAGRELAHPTMSPDALEVGLDARFTGAARPTSPLPAPR